MARNITEPAVRFPKVFWPPFKSEAEFIPGSELLPESKGRIFAVIVIAFFGEHVVMAEIRGRGVCVPSGRVESGETIDEAAVRESFEETGARLDPNRRQLIGCYRMTGTSDAGGKTTAYSACFVAEVVNFEPIPEYSESTGFFLLAPEDVQDHYFMWDDLLAAVFTFAQEERTRLFPPGDPIPGI
jgi:8-oxo-dGTP diphosphatase